MADYKYENLSVGVKEDPAAGLYYVGVEIAGAFVPFATLKSQAVEADIAAAQDAAAAAAQAQAQPPASVAPSE